MGSVSPLLAVAEALLADQSSHYEFLWIGTHTGPEKKVIEEAGISFVAISSGKFRRYVSFQNVFDVVRVLKGYWQAKKIVAEFRPDIVLTAGSFVCVPVVKAAYHLNVPYMIHQQDVVPGLANKLMAKNAARITVSLEGSLAHYSKEKTVLTGNPFRAVVAAGDKNRARKFFGFEEDDILTVLFIAGGTGAQALNEMVVEDLLQLTNKYQVIHITGKGKRIPPEKQPKLPPFARERYRQVEFLYGELKDAFLLADLVVSRASFSTLTELAYLGKSVVLIPMPSSHQVQNATWFKSNNAAVVLSQKTLTAQRLFDVIDELMQKPGERAFIARNIETLVQKDATQRFIAEMMRVLGR